MAARGTIAKQTLTQAILDNFAGSFIDDKVIRVPLDDGGEVVEIKVALTCAKDVIGGGQAAEVATPAETAQVDNDPMPNESEIQSIKKLFDTWNI